MSRSAWRLSHGNVTHQSASCLRHTRARRSARRSAGRSAGRSRGRREGQWRRRYDAAAASCRSRCGCSWWPLLPRPELLGLARRAGRGPSRPWMACGACCRRIWASSRGWLPARWCCPLLCGRRPVPVGGGVAPVPVRGGRGAGVANRSATRARHGRGLGVCPLSLPQTPQGGCRRLGVRQPWCAGTGRSPHPSCRRWDAHSPVAPGWPARRRSAGWQAGRRLGRRCFARAQRSHDPHSPFPVRCLHQHTFGWAICPRTSAPAAAAASTWWEGMAPRVCVPRGAGRPGRLHAACSSG